MDINEKLDAVILRVRSITKHFNYSEDVINILAICYIVIVSFDNDISDILEEVLATKYILVGSEGIYDVLEQNYPMLDIFADTYVEPSFDEKEIYNDDFIFIRKFNLIKSKNSSYYYENRPVCKILESFLHELKHAMNSVINRYKNGVFYCGICMINNKGERRFELLEEAFNSFLICLYLQQVNKLKDYNIQEEGIRTILESFSLEEYAYSYLNITSLLVPFFSDKELFTLFYNAVLYKDFATLFSALSKIFGNNWEYILDKLLAEFYNKFNCEILLHIKEANNSEKIDIDKLAIEKMTL